jgi:hypothetical protein
VRGRTAFEERTYPLGESRYPLEERKCPLLDGIGPLLDGPRVSCYLVAGIT